LRVTETIAINSEENFSVQLCDILAGLSSRNFDSNLGAEEIQKLDIAIRAGFGLITFDGIKPAPVFPKFPPKKSTGRDSIDVMVNIMGDLDEKKMVPIFGTPPLANILFILVHHSSQHYVQAEAKQLHVRIGHRYQP
jgi:hypothetical protein